MDPVSVVGIIGSVVGVADVVTQSIRRLSSLRTRYRDAPLVISLLIGQLCTTQAALDQLSTFTLHHLNNKDRYAQLAKQIDTALDAFRPLVLILKRHLDDFDAQVLSQMAPKSKMMWLWNETDVMGYTTLLDRQVNALSLLLQAIQCGSWTDQRQVMGAQDSRDIIELARDCTSSLNGRGSGLRSASCSMLSEDTKDLSVAFDFDQILLSSHVYHLAQRSNLKQLLRSAGAPAVMAVPNDAAMVNTIVNKDPDIDDASPPSLETHADAMSYRSRHVQDRNPEINESTTVGLTKSAPPIHSPDLQHRHRPFEVKDPSALSVNRLSASYDWRSAILTKQPSREVLNKLYIGVEFEYTGWYNVCMKLTDVVVPLFIAGSDLTTKLKEQWNSDLSVLIRCSELDCRPFRRAMWTYVWRVTYLTLLRMRHTTELDAALNASIEHLVIAMCEGDFKFHHSTITAFEMLWNAETFILSLFEVQTESSENAAPGFMFDLGLDIRRITVSNYVPTPLDIVRLYRALALSATYVRWFVDRDCSPVMRECLRKHHTSKQFFVYILRPQLGAYDMMKDELESIIQDLLRDQHSRLEVWIPAAASSFPNWAQRRYFIMKSISQAVRFTLATRLSGSIVSIYFSDGYDFLRREKLSLETP